MVMVNDKRCGVADRAKSIPKEPHFAIVCTSSYYTPGDQRSRDVPGHGYPGGSTSIVTYRWFLDRDEWEEGCLEAHNRREEFVAMEVKPAQVAIKAEVKLRDK